MDALRLTTIAQPQNWPVSIWALLITLACTFAVQLVRRPSFPKTAPKFFKDVDMPILGALRFYSHRLDVMTRGMAAHGGNFSFYIGKNQVVGMSGLAGRKTFFESKELNMSEG
jgi:hypothetical protein